jgi:hypothetical protein
METTIFQTLSVRHCITLENNILNFKTYTLHPRYSERVGTAKIVDYNRVFTISEFTINGMKCNKKKFIYLFLK